MRTEDVLAAARLRRTLPLGTTDVLRLVDDGPDGCDGLVVDRYGPVLRLEVRARALPRELPGIAAALCRAEGCPHAVVLVRSKGAESVLAHVEGAPPAAHVVHEDGVRLLVKLLDPEAAGTGVFVDHRLGRRLVRDAARGRTVLNLFAHAGAFGAAAVAGGAARVDHVDAARKCAPWSALNLALNGVDPRGHRFVVDDALVFASKQRKKGARYGVVVCDPPTTALRPDGSRFHVEKDLSGLAETLCALVEERGALLLSVNDRDMPVHEVIDLATRAGRAAGRVVKSAVEVPLPPDVRSREDPRLRPMRGAWLQLV